MFKPGLKVSIRPQGFIVLECMFPENIHTPTTEGISDKTPTTSLEFPFFKRKINPPPLRNFQKHFADPPAPLKNLIWKRNNYYATSNIRLLSQKPCRLYIENNTWARGDMKFIFKCSMIITWVSAANEWDIEIEHEKTNFISPSSHVL